MMMMNKRMVFCVTFFMVSQIAAFSELERAFEESDAKQEQQGRIVGALVETIQSPETEKRTRKVVRDIKKLENSLRNLAFGTLEDLVENLATKEDAQEVLVLLLTVKKLAEQTIEIAQLENSAKKQGREAQLEREAMLFLFSFVNYLPALKKHETSLDALQKEA